MERLTKKNDDMGSYTQFGDKYIPNHNIRHKQCVEKLGKLEDIEQELGIPLEVLFKALKDGIYHIRYDSIFVDLTVTLKGNIVFQDSDNNLISLKDYGKTWWLEEPKEELGNA